MHAFSTAHTFINRKSNKNQVCVRPRSTTIFRAASGVKLLELKLCTSNNLNTKKNKTRAFREQVKQ